MFLKPQEKDGKLIHQSSVCLMNKIAGETPKKMETQLGATRKVAPSLGQTDVGVLNTLWQTNISMESPHV